MSPSLLIIDPRYRNHSLFGISWLSIFRTPFLFLLLLNLHSMYFVLDLLNLKHLHSKAPLQVQNWENDICLKN